MRLKLIAKIMIVAVMPYETVALNSCNVVWEPPAICTTPLVILKR